MSRGVRFIVAWFIAGLTGMLVTTVVLPPLAPTMSLRTLAAFRFSAVVIAGIVAFRLLPKKVEPGL
jgi:hypothetical protein